MNTTINNIERKEEEQLEVLKNESYKEFKKRFFDNSQFVDRKQLNCEDNRDYYSHCINYVLGKFCYQMDNLDRPDSEDLQRMIGQPSIVFCNPCFCGRKDSSLYYDYLRSEK